MNDQIKEWLSCFLADGKKIPIQFLNYEGTSDTYITYQEINAEAVYADDGRLAVKHQYDFDIFSKDNYKTIIAELTRALEDNECTLLVANCSADMYEKDTGYYHKTLCFEIIESEE